ncbi:DUF2268 domain-containing protein [Staphylococcus simiae]|uniref:DUF2268 domain-containing protein n=1 Tax=Staphylococcus simiae CCM 7213 = CCUG 51256 TaxID=911238 RepID=G5JKH6_9STAP|nr:DUF2268 domain-containing putative Zn-dependent protease [Staphylococcus simiae]EHJ07285.1 hypothetical protein SS7213T_09984 [Staphylococcus simiae CCM 7213 = CCUG 51256]PNZ14346.1 metallopeptidase [Staphylococcus simiae]SNV80836.1 Zn-dependent protease-protein [Staphylococcus simiae]
MYQLNIYKTDQIYNHLLSLPVEERNNYFINNLINPFEGKFNAQHIPLKAQSNNFVDALFMLNQIQLSPEKLSNSDLQHIKHLNDDFWLDCDKYFDHALKAFADKHIFSKIKHYHFTALLGDKTKPAMYLNNNYLGDGGIPGYIIIYLIPNIYTLSKLKGVITHEVNHNVRYQYIDWDGGSLKELVVAEGLAENFVEHLYGKNALGPWVTAINWQDNKQSIKNIINTHLDITDLVSAMPYLYGDDITTAQGGQAVGLPHAAGYTYGYYLIKYFLAKTNIPIEEATILPAETILNEVTEFWNITTH